MVFITSVEAIRRLTSLNLDCAFRPEGDQTKPYLNMIMEPELQLSFLFRLACLDVFLETDPLQLLEWVKVTHEFNKIISGLRYSPPTCSDTSEEGKSLKFAQSVLKRPFRSVANAKSYGGSDHLSKCFRVLGHRFCDIQIGIAGNVTHVPECM
mmetsp:Transcript_9586/g.18376  ORF Transcript_9586/g.18376 Transcript_9586/m.18376 type:complete len:153 (-) Transcript_9586:267-725(-)